MLDDERGVSVIIGAMMLILITIIAAASLAVIVSQAEKQAADRNAARAAVENEKLVITGIDPELAADGITIKSLNISVQNLNIDLSRLLTFYVNDKPCFNYSLVGMNGHVFDHWKDDWSYNYNITRRLDIDGKDSAIINVNFTPDMSNPDVPRDYLSNYQVRLDKSITIKIMTSYYNTFNRTFGSPNAIANVKVLTQDLGSFKRDYLSFDGSGSSSDNSIVGWQWNIFHMENYTQILPPIQGKVAVAYMNVSGPFRVNLTVTDSNHLTSTSEDIVIPRDDAFNPPSHIFWTQDESDITLIVTNVENQTMNGAYVNLIPLYDRWGNLTLDKYSGVTGNNGTFTFKILSGSGTITATVGPISTTVTITKSEPQPPAANFTVNNSRGTLPLVIQFWDNSTNEPTSWQWYFGDNTANSTDKNPIHTFNSVGTFDVTLTVTNSVGSNSIKNISCVIGDPTGPTANFDYNSTGPYSLGTGNPVCILFNDTSYLASEIIWNVYDESHVLVDTSDEHHPVFQFSAAGTFEVTLIARSTGFPDSIKTENIIVTS